MSKHLVTVERKTGRNLLQIQTGGGQAISQVGVRGNRRSSRDKVSW